MGFGVDVVPGHGPVIDSPFRGPGDLRRLRPLEPETDTPYVTGAVRAAVSELASSATPLIGFAGAPFTVASYLIEGGPSRTFAAGPNSVLSVSHLSDRYFATSSRRPSAMDFSIASISST